MTQQKKINIKLILVLLICVLFLIGCSKVSICKANSSKDQSMFILIENMDTYSVVYHRDTKVMYVVSDSPYNHGTFTLLVDAQGKPMLWRG